MKKTKPGRVLNVGPKGGRFSLVKDKNDNLVKKYVKIRKATNPDITNPTTVSNPVITIDDTFKTKSVTNQ